MLRISWSSYIVTRSITLLYLFCLLLPLNSFAHDTHSDTIEHAKKLLLWEKIEWLNLLHYNKDSKTYNSKVNDDRFFYAEDGKKNPESELIETLKNLYIPTEDHNQQTQCRFVARVAWLSSQLDIDEKSLPVVNCDKYLQWHNEIHADSVTMIFPAYHLNSPSSMFGHTLLRLDNKEKSDSTWLSYAVNFGANINSDDNSMLYAFRGLAGGYPGLFITEPYFKKIQEYNRIEHRDIWEYQLNLTPVETEKLVKHLWELKDVNFDYYFLDENCSYRLLELIEVARPSIELTDEFILTAIPVDTVRAMDNAQLIEAVSYRPAQATEIQYILEILPDSHQDLVIGLSMDIDVVNTKEFTELSTKKQKKIVDLAYKYLRYQNTKYARDPVVAKRSYKLLQKLSSYPGEIDIDTEIPVPLPPEKAHKSKRITVALGERLNNKYADLGFKMAFHDLEDNKNGFLQGAQINVINLNLRAEENVGLRLYQLTFVDVFSLTPRNEFFKPLSWRIYSGFERQLTFDKDQLVYHVTGGAGGTWEIIKNHQYYALAIGRLEINKQLKNAFEPGIGFITGFLSHFKHTTARLEVSGEHFEDGVYRLRAQYTQNIVFSTNHSIKLFARHEWHEDDVDFSDINLGYQYYF